MTDERPEALEGIKPPPPLDDDEGTVDEPVEDVTDDGYDGAIEPDEGDGA